MRIGFLMVASEFTHSTPVTYDVMYLLQDRGIQAVPIIPEHEIIDLEKIDFNCDLYVLRPSAEIILSLAGILDSMGALILNDYHSCAQVRDKVQVAARLLQAGLPFPKSYVTGDIEALRRELQSSIIIKPERGALGEGIAIIDMDDQPPRSRKGGYFAQQYLQTDHYDLKVYVIGNDVMARKRHFPCVNDGEFFGVDCEVTPEVHKLALDCGKIFNLEIYGLDIVQTRQGLFVVDVNYFPSFLGVPDAAEKLADYIHQYALRKIPQKTKMLK